MESTQALERRVQELEAQLERLNRVERWMVETERTLMTPFPDDTAILTGVILERQQKIAMFIQMKEVLGDTADILPYLEFCSLERKRIEEARKKISQAEAAAKQAEADAKTAASS
jgi:DNA repair exonuclease SbcCD ATPase subunit